MSMDSNKVLGIFSSFLIALLACIPFTLVFLFGTWTLIVDPLVADLILLGEFAAIVAAGAIIGGLLGGYVGANSAKAGISYGIIGSLGAFGFWVLSDLYYGIVTLTIDLTAPLTFFYLMVLAVAVCVVAGVIYKIGQYAMQ